MNDIGGEYFGEGKRV